jgi:hypothetical protein
MQETASITRTSVCPLLPALLVYFQGSLHQRKILFSLLTLYHTTECIFFLKEEERWKPSQLDKWHTEPGSG